MSWTEKTVIDAEPVASLIRRSIRVRRCMGFKVDHAFEDAALALGTSPRRIRSLLRGEVFKIAVEEYQRILSLWWSDIHQQAAKLTAQAIQIEKEAEAEWLAQNQMSLPLEDPQSPQYGRPSASGAGAERLRVAT